jgi:hypothetical protein
MDINMASLYNLPVPIRPIAFRTDSVEHDYIFVAGGKYYFFGPQDEQLWRFVEEGLRDDNILSAFSWARRERLYESEEGYEKLYDLEEEEMTKARIARRGE